MGTGEDVLKVFKDQESQIKELTETIRAQQEELASLKKAKRGMYMFPSTEIVPFEEIVQTYDKEMDPVSFRKAFVSTPEATLKAYLAAFYTTINKYSESLNMMGIDADGTNLRKKGNEIMAFASKYPDITTSKEFMEDYPKNMQKMMDYINGMDRIFRTSRGVVFRCACALSMMAYYTKMKADQHKEETLIIEDEIKERLVDIPEPEEEEVPLEEGGDLFDDPDIEGKSEEPDLKEIEEENDPGLEEIGAEEPPKKEGLLGRIVNPLKEDLKQELFGERSGDGASDGNSKLQAEKST